MECLTVDACSCATAPLETTLFARRMRLREPSDSHGPRNLQVDCSSISKRKNCGNAPGCQWNGKNGCVVAATSAPTPPPTSNPTNAPSNSPTSHPTPSVSLVIAHPLQVHFNLCSYFFELTPLFISTALYDCSPRAPL